MISVDAEVKERLENWRRWVFSAHYPGMLSGQNIIQGILDNTAQAANHYPRAESFNAECEETDSWIQALLDDPDTYLGGLAVKMKYSSHHHTPTQHHARLFPTAYGWMNWKKAGGEFDDFRMAVTQAQNLKREYPDDYARRHSIIKLGVTDRSFAETELEGRNIMIGMIKHLQLPQKKRTAVVYELEFAQRG